jgi:ribosomal protein S18 acetylase RimI-like enzyme
MIEIRPLRTDDASLLSASLQQASEDDRKYFHPFDFSVEVIRLQLQKCVSDTFVGLFVENGIELAGFYMLRGVDEGYQSPMYGVFVGPKYRRKGLARLSLVHAMAVCRMRDYPSLLLKVYESNINAVRLYETMGFEILRKQDGQLVMELSIDENASR